MPVDPALSPGLRAVRVQRRDGRIADDLVAVEEPLEIHVNDKPLVVTMRTPGHDKELAAGFLFGEGIVSDGAQILSIDVETGAGPSSATVRVRDFSGDRVRVTLRDRSSIPEGPEREFRATAACGVCGKTEIGDLPTALAPVTPIDVDRSLLETLPDALRQHQELFDATGGVHAAGIFDRQGSLVYAREDIGRHNAVDKVVGCALLDGQLPLADHILVVSGRAGFELVQKAIKAAIPVMVSVGAASSVAVRMATEAHLMLYSFAGPGRGHIHVHADHRR